MTSARSIASARSHVAWLTAAAITWLASTATAVAQDPSEYFVDFIHYTLVAKPDLAAANAQALLDSGLADADLTRTLEEMIRDGQVDPNKFETAIDRALHIPELRDTAEELWRRVEEGHRDLSREPERIKSAISMLTGPLRHRQIAEGRLEAAGEYAVPYLLLEITEGRDDRLKLACGKMLERIGRQAVTPLCEALPNVGDVNVQRLICDTLGEIRYPHAAAALWETAQDPNTSDSVREAAVRAFRAVGGAESELSLLYSNLGTDYFNEDSALIAFPSEATNNVWSYDTHVGLLKTPVPTDIYNEVMAMRMASKALGINSNNGDALSLFVASNLKRENDLVQGEDDPIYGALQYTPSFYATVFGTSTCMTVLEMALDKVDTPLIRDAIAALSQTTGGANLFNADSGRQPLIEALSYPDRRVQYEAALTLARALPDQPFAEDYKVVPMLANAVRTGGELFAMVAADNSEDRREITSVLEKIGFTVLAAETSVENLRPSMTGAIAIDVVVVKLGDEDMTRSSINELRRGPKTLAAPIIVLAGPEASRLDLEYRADRRVNITRFGSEDALANAVENGMAMASGGRMTEAEAEEYALEALGALRDVAISKSTVYAIADAQPALLDALAVREGGVRMFIAEIISLIDNENAQRALFDAALAADPADQPELLAYVADSVRTFGSYAEPHQVDSLLRIIRDASGDTAAGAARVHGAMNRRPTPAAVELVPKAE